MALLRGSSNGCRTSAREGSGSPASGFTLVALVVAITVMNILVAAALQPWGQYMQREREKELIFRGLQYAEAIRVYQIRFGRLPNRLEQLIEEEPRSIRKLYSDPMTEDGEWELIKAQDPRALRGPNAGSQGTPDSGLGGRARRDAERQLRQRGRDRADNTLGLGGSLAQELGRVRAEIGPIIGVKSKSTDESILMFMEQEQHDLWEFSSELLTVQSMTPGTDAPPRLTAAWIGRPFRQGLTPTQLPLGGGGTGGLESGSGPNEGRSGGLQDAFDRGDSSNRRGRSRSGRDGSDS